ncbi:MAG TPA: GNAT family N-acetyltransferase [Thermoanaerobaculia bacterium]|nr:GNAT family N-acetyltransferase [Thermoanaerobaculia bacterium]
MEPLAERHAALTFDCWQDERLYAFIPFDPPGKLGTLEKRYRELSTRRSPDGSEEWLNWFLKKKSDDEYVGLVQATIRRDSSADLAYFTFAAHWRNGFAHEGCRAVVEFLLHRRGVREIVAEIDARNLASQRLIEKLGFRQAAFTPNAAVIRGVASDEYRYVLGPNDWKRRIQVKQISPA